MPDKIKMQLGRPDGEAKENKKSVGKNTEKVNEFLNSQTGESNKDAVRPGNSLKVTEEGKLKEVREDLLSSYPPEKPVWVAQEIPFTENENTATVVKQEKKGIVKSLKDAVESLKDAKDKLFMTLGFITLAGAANATINNSAEKEFSSNKNTTEYINTDPGEGGKKVKQVPPGYVKSHVDGKKTYYKKVAPGEELKPAKSGDGKGGAEYEKWLINTLKSGKYSPEELVGKGYISDAEKYRKYYTPPAVDIVYTEPEETKSKEADPYSAYAEWGESIWGTNRHLIGFLCAAVRDTKSITDAGNLNTSKSEHKVLLRLVDKMGKPTGECIELTTGEVQNYFGTTMTTQSDELLAELKKRIKKPTTYTATAEDFANNK